MSPVNAEVEEHYINGKIGSVFKFSDSDVNLAIVDFRDTSIAFEESGLFNMKRIDEGGPFYDVTYICTAIKPGFKVVDVDHWQWKNSHRYYFDIEL
jgi:hypothetical protein